jgi:lysophospholipase L1-like esterase
MPTWQLFYLLLFKVLCYITLANEQLLDNHVTGEINPVLEPEKKVEGALDGVSSSVYNVTDLVELDNERFLLGSTALFLAPTITTLQWPGESTFMTTTFSSLPIYTDIANGAEYGVLSRPVTSCLKLTSHITPVHIASSGQSIWANSPTPYYQVASCYVNTAITIIPYKPTARTSPLPLSGRVKPTSTQGPWNWPFSGPGNRPWTGAAPQVGTTLPTGRPWTGGISGTRKPTGRPWTGGVPGITQPTGRPWTGNVPNLGTTVATQTTNYTIPFFLSISQPITSPSSYSQITTKTTNTTLFPIFWGTSTIPPAFSTIVIGKGDPPALCRGNCEKKCRHPADCPPGPTVIPIAFPPSFSNNPEPFPDVPPPPPHRKPPDNNPKPGDQGKPAPRPPPDPPALPPRPPIPPPKYKPYPPPRDDNENSEKPNSVILPQPIITPGPKLPSDRTPDESETKTNDECETKTIHECTQTEVCEHKFVPRTASPFPLEARSASPQALNCITTQVCNTKTVCEAEVETTEISTVTSLGTSLSTNSGISLGTSSGISHSPYVPSALQPIPPTTPIPSIPLSAPPRSIPDGTKIRLLGIGDSITVGYPNAGDSCGYRAQLLRDLSRFNIVLAGTESWYGDKSTNYFAAWSGQTIQYIIDHVDDSLKQRPNLVLIHAGTNDMASDSRISRQGNDPRAAVGRLGVLVDKVIAACPDAVILVARIIHTRDPEQDERTKEYQSLIYEAMASRRAAGAKLMVVDFTSFLINSDVMGDSWHPNPEGYKIFGDYWARYINEIPADWITEPIGPDPDRSDDDGSLNGGLDMNIPPPNWGNNPVAPGTPQGVAKAALITVANSNQQCYDLPIWQGTGQIALGLGRNGDWHYNKAWVQGDKIADGIHRDHRYVRSVSY